MSKLFKELSYDIIKWHPCVHDCYANGSFGQIESDCTFNDGLRSCTNNNS